MHNRSYEVAEVSGEIVLDWEALTYDFAISNRLFSRSPTALNAEQMGFGTLYHLILRKRSAYDQEADSACEDLGLTNL